LQCAPQIVPEMPHVTWADFAAVPGLYAESLNYLLLLNPPLRLGSSLGERDVQFETMLRFLNYPRYANRDGMGPRTDYYTISGWYVKSGRDWLSAAIADLAGPVGELRFQRRVSPDLGAGNFMSIAWRRSRIRTAVRSWQTGQRCRSARSH
jgi:hypothetical protein